MKCCKLYASVMMARLRMTWEAGRSDDQGRDVRRLVALFMLSRVLTLAIHVNPRPETTGVMHLLAPEWISFENLLIMPGQPPAFTLLSLVLFNGALVFIAFTSLGLVMMLAVYDLARRHLVLSRRLSWWGTLLFSLAPSTMLYERQLLYTYPIMAALTVGLSLVARARSRSTKGSWVAALGCLALPCWMHAFFHPIYLAAVVLGIAPTVSAASRKTLFLAAMFVLPLAALPTIKNGVLFDTWAGSTWGPFSLANVVHFGHPQADPYLKSPPFITPLETYPLQRVMLDNPMLSSFRNGDGTQNWHSIYPVILAKPLLAATLTDIGRNPWSYWSGVQGAAYFFLQSPSQGLWVKNRDRLGWYDKAWALATTGAVNPDVPIYATFRATFDPVKNPMPIQLFSWGTRFGWWHFPWLSLVVLPMVFVHGAQLGFVSLRSKAECQTLHVVMVMIAAYVTLLSLCLELGENMRFRAYIGPILTLWFLSLASGVMRTLKSRGARGSHA